MTRHVLHNYFRSSTSHRVRIALALKGIDYAYASYHLRKGEQRGEKFLSLNPQGLVPALELPDGTVITQSLAIIEYLDETVSGPALLPADPLGRARVRELSHMIALDIHPINNLRVLQYLSDEFGAGEDAVAKWFRRWVAAAFDPLEQRLAASPQTGTYCYGEQVTLADICLAAQIANNRRFSVDMAPYPTLKRIGDALAVLPAFVAAAPETQPDKE